jgi:hypothetical protein
LKLIKYLITGNEVFPLALALLSAAIETLFLHPCGDDFPEKLVPLCFHEISIQLCSDHQELLRFLETPLRKSVARVNVNADMMLLLLMVMMMTLHNNNPEKSKASVIF